MNTAMIGLGKMGAAMVRRLRRAGHALALFDQDPVRTNELAGLRERALSTLAELCHELEAPRLCWLMLPAGEATNRTIEYLLDVLKPGDTIVDGGNSYYRDTVAAATHAAATGIELVDVGTSGGVRGEEAGFCMTVGGSSDAVSRARPIVESLAPRRDLGWSHVGPAGAGHFVKMIHNGIEYGIMQAYAEGFQLLSRSGTFDLDVADIAETWRCGSVIRSWLLDLSAEILADDPSLETMPGFVPDSGEARWTVIEATEERIPTPIISLALQQRFRSRQEETFADKVLAALRNKFGGHPPNPEYHESPSSF